MPQIKDQPPPEVNDSEPIWPLVIADAQRARRAVHRFGVDTVQSAIADMRERDRIGRGRYGTPLQAHNGRDALVDAYQEALDLAVYLRQAMEEWGHDAIRSVYQDSLNLVFDLRQLLRDRAA